MVIRWFCPVEKCDHERLTVFVYTSINTKCMATGARQEVRMVLLGRTGTGVKSTEIILHPTAHSLLKAKVH
jgi:hypothetical protein